MKKTILSFPFLVLLTAGNTLLCSEAFADAAEERGLEIAKAVDVRDEGFGDSIVSVEMELKNAAGDVVTRNLSISTLEVLDDGDKSMIYFEGPAEVKGTALLTWTHALEPDEQWLFLPTLERVKRVSSNNKSGPFMGSEFALEDMSNPEVEKYTYRYLGDEPCVDDKKTCHVVERYPAYEDSGYSKLVSRIDTEYLNVQQIDYYDRTGALFKTLYQSRFGRYQDRIWRAHRMVMKNHLTRKETKLEWGNYKFGNGLTDVDFTKNRLKVLP